MEASGAVAETQTAAFRNAKPEGLRRLQGGVRYGLYGLALAVSISTWLIAIRAPLWLDETLSFFVIKGGLAKILSRQGWPGVPAYPFLLWLWAKAMGTGEIALRVSSILAMLGAVYLLYRVARELFDWDVAIIVAVMFCLHPVVFAESIDVRPYAFAALAITASMLALVHLRHNHSNWLAALFGFSAASIVYFQFLFAVILPALAISFFALKVRGRQTQWRQISVASGVFALAFVPVIPGLQFMLHTSGTHVFESAPTLAELGQTLIQKRPLEMLAVAILIAAATRRHTLQSPLPGWPTLFCVSTALVPALILYGVSAETSLHIFVFRYRLVAAPGAALCWGLVVSRMDSRALRLLLCVAVVAVTAYHYFTSPASKVHNYSWKTALQFTEKNASADNSTVLICSDLPESDHMAMPPASEVKDSAIFAPLSYYQLSVPVVALPRALNDQASRIGSQFLQQAAQRHERFLAMAFVASYNTLDWLADEAAGTYDVRELGVLDGVKVLEFKPRLQADASH